MNASVRHACKTVEPQQNSRPRRGRGGAVQHLQQDSKPKGCDDAVFGLKFKLWRRHVQVSFLEKREGHALALSFPRASPSSLARGSADTLLMFEHDVTAGHKVPVVTQASLEEYRDTFRDMVVNYPEAWHLLVVAEDRCRCEHFPRLKRECQDKSDKGQLPDFVAEQPWDYVFRAAARDRDYWDRNVREPAILFRTAGGKKK